MQVLVTGGLGYIGAHVVIELLQKKTTHIVIIDNLHNSNIETLDIIKNKAQDSTTLRFVQADICNTNAMEQVFAQHTFDVVYHFAALKSISESLKIPEHYQKTNYDATVELVALCTQHNVRTFVFSSSATVYGQQEVPAYGFTESDALPPEALTHTYGKSKRMVEMHLQQRALESDCLTTFFVLRYFNPIGNISDGSVGDALDSQTPNLFTIVAKAYTQNLTVQIFGDDYNTPDGTCLRDFIHVTDVARAHLHVAESSPNGKYKVYNIGTGVPISVSQLINTFERVVGCSLQKKKSQRRLGDAACSFANVVQTNNDLQWHAHKTIDEACEDVIVFINLQS